MEKPKLVLTVFTVSFVISLTSAVSQTLLALEKMPPDVSKQDEGVPKGKSDKQEDLSKEESEGKEEDLPPGISKKGEIPGKGLHKGWKQGKHKGWNKKQSNDGEDNLQDGDDDDKDKKKERKKDRRKDVKSS